jgi:cell division protein FtsB
MAGTGYGGSGAGKPARGTSTSRRSAASRRSVSARPGAGPGRSRPSGAVRKAASAQISSERRATRGVMRVAVLATIVVLLAVTLVPTLRSYLRQQGDIDALRGQVTEQRVQVAELQKEQARWNDDAYVMQQARERLKFVKVGEKSYSVIDGAPEAKVTPGMAKAPASAGDHPWYGQLWESVRVADAGPGPGTPSTVK